MLIDLFVHSYSVFLNSFWASLKIKYPVPFKFSLILKGYSRLYRYFTFLDHFIYFYIESWDKYGRICVLTILILSRGQWDRTGDKVTSLHMVHPGLIPSTIHGSLSIKKGVILCIKLEVIPKHCWLCAKIKPKPPS